MDTNNKIIVNSTRLRGLVENINKISFHQQKAKDLTECVLLQYQDILNEAMLDKKQERAEVVI